MLIEWALWVVQKTSEYSLSSFRSWDSVTAAIGKVAGTFTDLESGMAWPYLLASLLIGGMTFILARMKNIAPSQSFGGFLFPRHVYGHPSAVLDYKFYVVNVFLKYLLLIPVMGGVGMVGYKAMTAVMIGYFAWEPPRTLPPTALFAVAAGFFVVYDLVNYLTHVLFHKIPVLWAFHRVHHSAEVLTPITAYRAHPVELLLPAVLQAPFLGMASVFSQNLVPHDMELTMVFGISVITFALGFLGHHWHHSHLWVSFGPVVSRLFISPVMHQIHHSVDPQHVNRNFGVKLAVWDVLFGTLYVPRVREPLRVGLQEPVAREFRKVSHLYFRPFVEAFGAVTMPLERKG